MIAAMVERARDAWYAQPGCVAAPLYASFVRKAKLRDAQFAALKTYLFLKLGCKGRPLWELYATGCFNTLDLYEANVTPKFYGASQQDPGLAAIYEYLQDEDISAKEVLAQIQARPEDVDARMFFRTLMGGVSYADYLFSLPMGAGKTFLMAAIIYIDLYYCVADPTNEVFARNYVVLAPSGLKSSVVPSLRTIRSFDPAWLFDDPVAGQLRSLLQLEVLDEDKAAKRSNQTMNPNAQKVAYHASQPGCMGLVFVTNAEKVILNTVGINDAGELRLFEGDADAAMRQANDLRRVIGSIPGLGIIIDEVHHASRDDVKLRAVVNHWVAQGDDVRGVLGFTGTPYLKRAERVDMGGGLGIRASVIPNTVYNYPLAAGIGNFLKRPRVEIVDGTSEQIVRVGLEWFLDAYQNVVYHDADRGDVPAKLAIYCGKVAKLEERMYPLVAEVLSTHGIDAGEWVLKYHRGGTGERRYATDPSWETEFSLLDTSASKRRIALLAGIGHEGWDCRSLSCVILSQEGDCTRTQVLQTGCRCLREVADASGEKALIVLNAGNAKLFANQLRQQYRTDLKTFTEGQRGESVHRTSRMDVLDIPPIAHHRFQLSHNMTSHELPREDIANGLDAAVEASRLKVDVQSVDNLDFEGTRAFSAVHDDGWGEAMGFSRWLWLLRYETGPCEGLERYVREQGADALRAVFDQVSLAADGVTYLRADIGQMELRSRVRSLFYPRRQVKVHLEDAGEVAFAHMVDEERLSLDVVGTPRNRFYPTEEEERRILASDSSQDIPIAIADVVELLEAQGQHDAARKLLNEWVHNEAQNTYQYIPYHFDSPFEREYYMLLMGCPEVQTYGLEVYYNGDRSVADFRISCLEERDGSWRNVGWYTPDFLVVQREGGSIAKTLIIETKGAGYGGDERFLARRAFVERVFIPQNNAANDVGTFDYLLASDGDDMPTLRRNASRTLAEFFGCR